MGNVEGIYGPLPDTWISNQAILQKQILSRMRSFGMTTILPAFSGHVPRALTRVFPNASVTRLASWNGFNG